MVGIHDGRGRVWVRHPRVVGKQWVDGRRTALTRKAKAMLLPSEALSPLKGTGEMVVSIEAEEVSQPVRTRRITGGWAGKGGRGRGRGGRYVQSKKGGY